MLLGLCGAKQLHGQTAEGWGAEGTRRLSCLVLDGIWLLPAASSHALRGCEGVITSSSS